MSNVTKVETLDNLLDILDTQDNVVVVFSAVDWCVPCQRLAPHAKAAAETLDGYTFLDVDVDHVDGVKEQFNIMSVPQVWFYPDNTATKDREIKARTTLQLVSEIRR